MGLDASVVERVDRNPRLKARFGPFYFVESAIATFLARYVVNPPRLTSRSTAARSRGVSAVRPERRDTTRTSTTAPVAAGRGRRASTPATCSGVVLTRARPYDVPTVTFRALSQRARIAKHHGIEAFGGFAEAVVRSVDGRPIPIQVDGDHIGDELEARFAVEPKALRARLLIPSALEPLITRSGRRSGTPLAPPVT